MSLWVNHPPPNGFWEGQQNVPFISNAPSVPLTPPLTPSSTRLPHLSVHGSPDSPSSHGYGSHSGRSSSPPYSLISHEDPSVYNGSSVTSAQSDRAFTPKLYCCPPYSPSTWTPYERRPTDHFLLIGTVPRESTDLQLKQAFKSCGDLIGIFVRFLSQNGVVILAFHDSRQCLQAHLTIHNQALFPDVRPLNSQLLSPHAIRSLVGNSTFVSEAEAGVCVRAEAFVNSAVLYGLLLSYGELVYFQPTDYDGTGFICEYYDGRNAREAVKGLHENTTRLGVRLQVFIKVTESYPGSVVPIPPVPPMTPGTPRAHVTLPPCSPDQQSSPQNPERSSSVDDGGVFLDEEVEMEKTSSGASNTRQKQTVQQAIDDQSIILPSRQSPQIPSRRCSTGSAFCPGETTPLERFRASSRNSNKGDEKVSRNSSVDSKDKQDVAELYDPVLHHKVQQLLSHSDVSPHRPNLSASRHPSSTTTNPGAGQPTVAQRRSIPPPNQQGHSYSPTYSSPNRSEKSWRSPTTGAVPFPFDSSAPRNHRRQINDSYGDLIYTTEGSDKPPIRLKTQGVSNYIPPGARVAMEPGREPLSPRNVVDLEKIEKGLDTRTTIMIKNVPSRMTHEDMFHFISKDCPRSFDFLYLRMDFVTGNNVGYAFVNFVEMSDLLKFLKTNLGTRWNLYSSEKTMQAAYATYQGKSALVTKFQNSSILDREKHVQPHIYYSSGPNKGLEEPFPAPNDSVRKARSLAAANEHGLYNSLHRRGRPPRVFGYHNSSNASRRPIASAEKTGHASSTSEEDSDPFTVQSAATSDTNTKLPPVRVGSQGPA